MVRIAQLIDIALAKQDEATLNRVKGEVKELTSAFPLYQAKPVAGSVRRSA
jgi:glycine/serine hydroxymethyltransferase